jgi:hypothetical protein
MTSQMAPRIYLVRTLMPARTVVYVPLQKVFPVPIMISRAMTFLTTTSLLTATTFLNGNSALQTPNYVRRHLLALAIPLHIALASHCKVRLPKMMVVILVVTGRRSQDLPASIPQTRIMGGRSSYDIWRRRKMWRMKKNRAKRSTIGTAAAAMTVAMTTTTTTTMTPTRTATKAHDLQSGAGRLPPIAVHPQSGAASVVPISPMVNLMTPLVLPLPLLNPPTSEILNWLIELQVLTRNGKSAVSLAGKRLMVLCNTG